MFIKRNYVLPYVCKYYNIYFKIIDSPLYSVCMCNHFQQYEVTFYSNNSSNSPKIRPIYLFISDSELYAL